MVGSFSELLLQEGCGVIHGAIDHRRAAALASAIEAAQTEDPVGALELRVDRFEDSPQVFADLASEPRIVALLSSALQCIPHLVASYGHIKPAGAAPHTRWHSDVAHLPGRNPNRSGLMYKAVFALDSVADDGGAIDVIPRSHTGDTQRDQVREVRIELQPGDLFIFDANILHSSSPNKSSRDRKTLWLFYALPWMRCLAGYEPSIELLEAGRQFESARPWITALLGLADPYESWDDQGQLH